MRERESFLRAFHDARPGITSRALARAGSYEKLAAKVPAGRILDLACGDGTLSRLLGARSIGLDVSRGELRLHRGQVVQARAQQLPFADHTFDAAACHLAFMLFEEPELVVGELHRVLVPAGRFVALLGGGPTADGHDAFHTFASLLPRTAAVGHKRDWHELFAGWLDVAVERWPLDLGGSFEDVWTFLGSSYQLRAVDAERVRAEVRAAFPGDHVPCTVVTYCATATR